MVKLKEGWWTLDQSKSWVIGFSGTLAGVRVTPENFYERISIYATCPGEAPYKSYHYQMLAEVFEAVCFPNVKFSLHEQILQLLKKQEFSSFSDVTWCGEYFTWLYKSLEPIYKSFEALL